MQTNGAPVRDMIEGQLHYKSYPTTMEESFVDKGAESTTMPKAASINPQAINGAAAPKKQVPEKRLLPNELYKESEEPGKQSTNVLVAIRSHVYLRRLERYSQSR